MINAKILLAEDDLFLRDIYKETLLEEFSHVISASDGKEALEKMQAEDWDVILLDVLMPKMTGIDVAKEILSHQTSKKENIIFLTNSNDSEDQRQIKDFGYPAIIKSDITPIDLIEIVKSHLQITAS